VLSPIVGANAYAALPIDIPHRLLVRGRLMPTDRWRVIGLADWRSGFPYSRVDAALDFVGPRSSDRFPRVVRVEAAVERRFAIGKWEPWIGVRLTNALNHFIPADVQNNVASPAFGSFYNAELRQLRLQIRFTR
jgi:hypothetical protein